MAGEGSRAVRKPGSRWVVWLVATGLRVSIMRRVSGRVLVGVLGRDMRNGVEEIRGKDQGREERS